MRPNRLQALLACPALARGCGWGSGESGDPDGLRACDLFRNRVRGLEDGREAGRST